MAAKEMYDYLPTVTPDYSATTLSVSPQRTVQEAGQFADSIFVTDDGRSEERLNFSSYPYFFVTLIFDAKSESDIGTILDFYYDAAKAAGRTKTFKWSHVMDGHTYVVRFESQPLTRNINYNHHSISSVVLKVVGKV